MISTILVVMGCLNGSPDKCSVDEVNLGEAPLTACNAHAQLIIAVTPWKAGIEWRPIKWKCEQREPGKDI